MTWINVTLDDWIKNQQIHADHSDLTMNGLSPGGAAGELGVSRHAIHMACKRGTLEGLRIVRDDGKLAMLIIPQRAIDAYRKDHLNWASTRQIA